MTLKVKLVMLLLSLLQHWGVLSEESSCSSTAGAPAKSLGLMQFRKETSLAKAPSRLGDAKCPCIGIDNINGSTTVVVGGSTRTKYPADTGAHCEAWDDAREPASCLDGQVPGAGHGWCSQPWCYVDPCNCDLDLKPKASSYLPDGMYQGKPLYFSYATCGAEDSWSAEQKHEIKEADKEMCVAKAYDSQVFGKNECKCIGISGEEGASEFMVSGKLMSFPASAGAKCGAWDLESNPVCSGNSTEVPAWCAKRWCFVDPCSCSLEVPPKASSYLPSAQIGGKSVYFSYGTCGDEDLWTAKNHKHACVNEKSEKVCNTLAKCGWDATKKVCLGKDLLETCHPASKARLKIVNVSHDVLDKKRMKNAETTVDKAVQYVAKADSAMKAAEAVEKKTRKAKEKSEAEADKAKATEHAAEAKSLEDQREVYKRSEEVAGLKTQVKNATAEVVAANQSEVKLAAKVAEKETNLAKAQDALKELVAAEKLADSKAKAAESAGNKLKLAVKEAAKKVDMAAEAENLTAAQAAEKKIDEMFWLSKLENLKAKEKKALHKAQEAQAVADQAFKKELEAKAREQAAVAKEVKGEQALSNATAKLMAVGDADKMVRTSFDRLYGNSKCPCIGIDNITGFTTVVVNAGTARYPADTGAHCAAWDDGREPSSCLEGGAPGGGHGWCAQSWCYVDPCNCDLEEKPKPTSYLPDGQYQGKPIYFSYATCGSKDTWSKKQKLEMKAFDKAVCEKKEHYSKHVGKNECKCIGIDGEDGATEFLVSGKPVAFPANAGATCGAWDLKSNPMCAGNSTDMPAWCAKKWCYVDPCSCSLEVPPKTSSYLPYARVGGKSVYFSYDTCGDDDVWTAKNHKHACVNQKYEKACSSIAYCGWNAEKKECLGKELLKECLHPEPIKTSTTTTTTTPRQDDPKSLATMLAPATIALTVALAVAQE